MMGKNMCSRFLSLLQAEQCHVFFLGFLFFLFPRFLFCMCVFCLLASCPLWAIVLTSLCLRIHDLASYSIRSLHLSSDRAQNSVPSFLGKAVGLTFKGGCKIFLFNLDFLSGLWLSVINLKIL